MTKEKKFLIILAIVLVIIILVLLAVVLVYKNKSKELAVSRNNIKQWKQNQIKKKTAPIIRYGKMFLKTNLDANKIKKGDVFTAQILLDTQGSDIVVASADLIYDAKKLKLINIDETNSVLSMSVVKNNDSGEINIIRGEKGDSDFNDFDDGFNGEKGILADLKFKVLAPKNIEINFNPEKSNMILDDGEATEMKVNFENLEINKTK